MNKKLTFSLGFLPFVPIVMSASCVRQNTDKIIFDSDIDLMSNEKFKKFYKKDVFLAEISQHHDGDTVSIKPLEDNGADIKKGQETKVRLAGVDTPEKSVGGIKSEDREYHYATLSSDFAKKTLPLGKKVYIFRNGSRDTYGRLTADIFYHPNKNDISDIKEAIKSYCVEIIKEGYSFPFADGAFIQQIALAPGSLGYFTIYHMAVAMKYAYINKLGFYADKSKFEPVKTYEDFANVNKMKYSASWKSFLKEYDKDSKVSEHVYDYAEMAYQPKKLWYTGIDEKLIRNVAETEIENLK